MQGGKNWILQINQCKPVLLGLSLAGNMVKLLMSLYETEWRERDSGLRATIPFALILFSLHGVHYRRKSSGSENVKSRPTLRTLLPFQ
jgi:hypothetical protein